MFEDEKTPKRQVNQYLKYSGLGLQLLITIGVAGWLGYLLDDFLNLKYPIFMLIFGFLAFVGTLYQLYRMLNKEK